MNDTSLQLMEDYEQLKILEHGYKIKSFATVEYNEFSLNTLEDYNFLKHKYK
jgi:CMP-2-keto-3-deoxyoctulosonic acid synthetase